MKSLLCVMGIAILLLAASCVDAQEFVSPVGFIDTQANRQKVMEYIKVQVREDASAKGENDPQKIRYYERENLKAFKRLMKVKNTALLEKIIKECCEIKQCSYLIFFLMYQDEDRSYPETIEW